MYWLTFFEITGVIILSYYIIQSYCQKNVPMYVQLLALIAWVMNFAIIILVPLDIFITMRNADAGLDPLKDSEYVSLTHTYMILYWGLFLMCWTVIPFVSDYESAVDLQPNDRLRRSFRQNVKFYIYVGILGAGFILYIILTNQTKEYGLLIFMKSMANCYGIALIMILLGYSLISIPRAHMRTAQFDLQMKYLYFRTYILSQEKKDAQHQLEERARRVIAIKNAKFENAHFDIYIKLSLETIPLKMQRNIESQMAGRKSSFIHSLAQPMKNKDIPNDIEEMIQIYSGLKRAYQTVCRIKAAYKDHLKKAFEMEDIIRCINSEKEMIDFTFKKQRTGKLVFLNYYEWKWLCYYKPQMKVILSVLLGVMSFLVLIQEVALFMNTNFTIFGIPLKLFTNIYWMQIFTFLPLLYIAFCVYYGLFRIKISGFYGLYPDHSTDAPSLLFATVNFSRASAPLCFNFLNIVRLKHSTAFNYVMGKIELIPIFGISFSAVFPLLLIVLCLINYYDLYDKLLNFLGMKQFLFQENFSDRLIYEGRDQLKQARQRWLSKWKQQNPQDIFVIVDGTGGEPNQLQTTLLSNKIQIES